MRLESDRPVNIVVIGAGGTGGYVIPHLYRIAHASERDIRIINCRRITVRFVGFVRVKGMHINLHLQMVS